MDHGAVFYEGYIWII
ncbi:hypothetical protein CK1_12370 [Ruminococcus sp. SR1/5]|nr:hypothetical protein CK1_12370 [Ruminococcus sp. SR1/5]